MLERRLPSGHRGALQADFVNDGADDLAVGVPGENVGSVVDAGSVNVLYGSTGTGLSRIGSQLFTQPISAVEADDQFGFALAAGDFNNDGADLGVGPRSRPSAAPSPPARPVPWSSRPAGSAAVCCSPTPAPACPASPSARTFRLGARRGRPGHGHHDGGLAVGGVGLSARRTEAGYQPVGDLGKAVVEASLLDDLDRSLQADHATAGGGPPPPPGRQAAPEQPEYCEAPSSADLLGRHPPRVCFRSGRVL
jgi:hypothetical protein